MTDAIERELTDLARARGLKLDVRQEAPDKIVAAFVDNDGNTRLSVAVGDRYRALDALRIAALEDSTRGNT